METLVILCRWQLLPRSRPVLRSLGRSLKGGVNWLRSNPQSSSCHRCPSQALPGPGATQLLVEDRGDELRTILRKHRLLIISGILGVSAAAISHAAITPYVLTSPVVVAAREIQAYERIEPGDLRTTDLPRKAVPKDHFSEAGLLEGAYALSRILPGQVVMSGHVARGKGEIGLSVELQSDVRCVFIPAGEERAVGGFIKRGEKVDVVFTPKGVTYAAAFGGGQASLVVRSLLVVEVCRRPSSGEFVGVVVLANRAEAEAIASSIETCAVSLLLAPKESFAGESTLETGAWLP